MRSMIVRWLQAELDRYLADALAYLIESGTLTEIVRGLSDAGRAQLRLLADRLSANGPED